MISRERLAWAMFTVAMLIVAVLLLMPEQVAGSAVGNQLCWMPEDLR